MVPILVLVLLAFANNASSQTWAAHGPAGGSVTALAIDIWRPSTLLVATATGGVFRTTDGGNNWTPAGLSKVTIVSLAFDSYKQIIYAGTWKFGVMRSSDGGVTWQSANQGINAASITALAVDSWTGVAYAGADRLYRSIDSGEHWIPISNGITGTVESVVLDPWRPSIMYVGTLGGGVFRTDDGGAQWHALHQGTIPNEQGTGPLALTVAVDVWVPDTVYFADIAGPLYRSTDRGTTWHVSMTGAPHVGDVVIDPKTHTTLYAASRTNGVLKTLDAGEHWFPVNSGLTSRDVTAFIVDPQAPATLYAGTWDRGMFRSTNAGATWEAINRGLDNGSVNRLAVDPWSSAVYSAGLGGVHKSTDRAATWVALNNGLVNTPQAPPLYLNTSSLRALVVDPWFPANLYAVSTDGGIFRSTDGGQHYELSRLPSPVTAIATDAYHANTLYAGTTTGLFKTTDGGGSWQSVAGLSGIISTVAVDPTNPYTIYAGQEVQSWCAISRGEIRICSSYSVAKTTDAGNTWTFASAAVTSLVIDPVTPTNIYSVNIQGNGIGVSRDGGATWALPNRQTGATTSLAIDPKTPTTLYAGSDRGVFRSTDAGATWTAINDGLSETFITSVAVDPNDPSTVYAATLEKGVFVLHQR